MPGINRDNLRFNVKEGNNLNSIELRFMMTHTDNAGNVLRRRWQGLRPYPNSVIDKNRRST